MAGCMVFCVWAGLAAGEERMGDGMVDSVTQKGGAAEEVTVRHARPNWKKLMPAEREAIRQQMRGLWQRLPPEEHARWQSACREAEAKKRKARENAHEGKQRYAYWGGNKEVTYGDITEHCAKKGYKAYWHSLSPEEQGALRGALREVISRKPGGEGE